MALPQIVRIQSDSDFTINYKLPKNYDNQDFIVRLYTTDKDNYYEASYRNGEYENCLTDGEHIVIYVNNHNLDDGNLHIWAVFDYENGHFQDGVENISVGNSTNVYLVKNNPDATSAMYVGTALPDFTSSVDFVTQSDLEFELLNYYTKEDIDNASYISSSDLNDYVTEEELNDMGFLSQAQLDAMGYATISYVDTKTNQKQDRLINGVNIKTVNGYSLLGNGNIAISGISQDDLDNAIAPLVSQEALTETLSYYVSHAELNSASYVTQSALNSMSYATQSFVDDAVADAMTEIVVPTYTSDLTNDSGFITASDLTGYATESYVSDYVAQHAPTPDMSAYVSYDWLEAQSYVTEQALSTAGYVTQNDLAQADYVTQSNLSSAGYATETYVSDYVSQYAPTPDLSAYVTKTELSNMSYVTESQLQQAGYLTAVPSEYVTETEIAGMGYVTATELSNASYATSTDLVSYLNIANFNRTVPVQLRNVGLTTITTNVPNSIAPQALTYSQFTSLTNPWVGGATMVNYVTEVMQNTLNNASYATTSQLATKQDTLVSGTNIKTVNNNSLLGSGNITISSSGNLIDEVTMTEYSAMQQAGTLDPNTIYVITDAPATDLSYYAELTYVDTYYVSKSALSNMGYATETYVSDYVAQHAPTPDLSAYVTKTELNNASYVTQTQLNSAGYLTSIPNTYATYAAISNMGYLTSANFIYDSSTYTLTISI